MFVILDMIRALFEGKLDPLTMIPCDADYKQTYKTVSDLIASLGNEENRKEIERLSDLMIDLEDQQSFVWFSLGLRWGAQMLIEILDEKNTPFQFRDKQEEM